MNGGRSRGGVHARAARVALVAALVPRALVADDAAAPRIREVEIRSGEVFTPEEAASGFIPYGLANLLRAKTHEGFVRRELLFRQGDVLDPEVLAETERLLRAYRIFRSVSVRPEGEKVVVETADAWTLLPRLAVSSRGGATTFGVGLDEQNLLGTGRRVSVRYDRGVERTERSFQLVDPDSLAPHTSLSIGASDLSDGELVDVGVRRPFESLDAEWAGSVAFHYSLFDRRVYSGGVEEAAFPARSRNVKAEVGRLVSLSDDRANRLLASVEWSDSRFLPGTGDPLAAPGDRAYLWILGGFETEGRRWLKVREADRIGRDEDFHVASFLRVQAGGSPRVGRARPAGFARLYASSGAGKPDAFGVLSVSAESRWEDGPRATRVEAALKGFLLRPPVTIAARLEVRGGWRLDPEDRFELDGENGLRGYRLHAVNGTRNAVLNVEARRLIVPDLLHLVSLGVAAFADAGLSAGPPDGTRRLANVGVGLRVGLGRASRHDLLRIDLARSLVPDPLGRTGWLVSFGSGQAF